MRVQPAGILKRILSPAQPFQNEGGNLILALAFSIIVLVATIFSTTMAGNSSIHAQTSTLSVESNLSAFEYDMVAHIQNPVIWNQIVASPRNGNLQRCFTDPTFDCPNVATPLVLLKADGSVYYDSASLVAAVDRYGKICDNFGAVDAPNCAFKFNITWAPRCDALTADCKSSPIAIVITLKTPGAKDSKIQISPLHYAVNLLMN